jgi:hypothetical protein
MKKLLCAGISYAALAVSCPAAAAPLDDDAARLAAIERENAILRKENAALRERAQLQRDNARLRDKLGAQAPSQEPAPVPPAGSQRLWVQEPSPITTPHALPPEVKVVIADPWVASAYGADMGVPLKAPALVKGEFNVFVEGGAFWTGGDPARTFTLLVASPFGPELFESGGPFNLNPRLGWDAGVGFDYRFAGSPWHVSAQFRYGEARKSDSNASGFGPTLLPRGVDLFNTSAATQTTASNRETHWLADFAIGRDLSGGPDAIQVKFGGRIAELAARIDQSSNSSVHATQFPFFVGGFFDEVSNASIQQNTSFRGAGPRIGVEGAIPLPAGWEVNYLAGAAALFGTRRFDLTRRLFDDVSTNVGLSSTSVNRFTQVDQKGAVVGNVDLQAGVAYWVTPNFRVSASYRLDAYFGALTTLDVAGNQRAVDRYFHGPRIAGSVRF